ncbi:MAG: hypothetical protein QM477_08050 [Planctomycetota bacterium]
MAAKKPTETIIVDIDISFARWVSIMVKLMFAAIPAAIIFFLLFLLFNFAMITLFSGMTVLSPGGGS